MLRPLGASAKRFMTTYVGNSFSLAMVDAGWLHAVRMNSCPAPSKAELEKMRMLLEGEDGQA